MDSLEDRLAALETAVAALTRASSTEPARRDPADEAASGETVSDDTFWLLRELQARQPEGAIAYAGHVDVAEGPVRWQIGADPHALLASDWHAAAGRLDALAHPVRLRLAQLVLTGITATADLAADEGLGTTGRLHHHLRQLVAAGWLVSVGRGRWSVPAPRVIPLLVIVAAAGT